jgi:hypothetical protein
VRTASARAHAIVECSALARTRDAAGTFACMGALDAAIGKRVRRALSQRLTVEWASRRTLPCRSLNRLPLLEMAQVLLVSGSSSIDGEST